MFEIGNSLREARLRQGLDLARVEDETKIRAKYLQALEDERFETLPAETYVKGFLRTYAEYLGLDGQIYVDEFNSRFASTDEPIVATPPRRRPRQRASESAFVVVALAGIVAVSVLVVVAFAFSGPDNGQESEPGLAVTQPTPGDGSEEAAPPPAGGEQGAGQGQDRVRLVLAAARGDCWVAVRSGRPDGELLFSGTIYQGERVRFTGRRLWLEFGSAPASNLNVRLNGEPVTDFPQDAPVVIVTPRGVRAQG